MARVATKLYHKRSYLQDRLGLLAGRCQWVADVQQRSFLLQRVDELWSQFGGRP